MRQGSEDDRFVDYIGAVQSIVTSGGINDSGLFETNLRDERFLPFEGAGAESTWKLDLPKDYRAFDYSTISDVILHIRYTARQGVDSTKVKTMLDNLFQQASQSNLALLFSLKHDFPTEWAKFVNGTGNFTATIKKDYFPYFIQNSIQKKKIKVTEIDLYNGEDVTKHRKAGDAERATNELSEKAQFTLDVGSDTAGPTQVLTRIARAEVFLIVRYSL
jgi:hypothetical protein